MTANRPEGHTPQAPAWTAVGLPEATVYSMLFARNPDSASAASEMRVALTTGDDTPSHLERARVANEEVPTAVFLGYWEDPGAYRRWRERADVKAAMSLPGVLEEAATIPADRWETLHSTGETTPGVRNLSPVQPTDVHEYWGAARTDRPARSDLAAKARRPCPPTCASSGQGRSGATAATKSAACTSSKWPPTWPQASSSCPEIQAPDVCPAVSCKSRPSTARIWNPPASWGGSGIWPHWRHGPVPTRRTWPSSTRSWRWLASSEARSSSASGTKSRCCPAAPSPSTAQTGPPWPTCEPPLRAIGVPDRWSAGRRKPRCNRPQRSGSGRRSGQCRKRLRLRR